MASISRTNSYFTKSKTPLTTSKLKQQKYDAVVIGAGHNGLIAAAYLAKSGRKVAVFEKRPVIGGAAVTQEIFPGFHFSTCSYLLSLLRPVIIKDLHLISHGLRWYTRDPGSFTPLVDGRYLLLGSDAAANSQSIARFSKSDACAYPRYERWAGSIVNAIDPLLDAPPLNLGRSASRRDNLRAVASLGKLAYRLGRDAPSFYELVTAPVSRILDRWFESDALKATLATDGVIGELTSPYSAGSGYVLLHHVMGGVTGESGQWVYVAGGMGAVSEAIAKEAVKRGVHIYTDKPVAKVTCDANGSVNGVVLSDGKEISCKIVLSNATPKITFGKLVDQSLLPSSYVREIDSIGYSGGAGKINIAVDRIPRFSCYPSSSADRATLPCHHGTIHLGCETMPAIHEAYLEAASGSPSTRPMVEMTIPSALDGSVAPAGGRHVVQLFVQYAPYTLRDGLDWDAIRESWADSVFRVVEEYSPGFTDSVIGRQVLTPLDLETQFDITGGNIFHGSMSLDQLYWARPVPSAPGSRTPLSGLYMCGSGAHPGGGVMGSPGRLAAIAALNDWKSINKSSKSNSK